MTGEKVFIGQETGRTGDGDRQQDSQNRATGLDRRLSQNSTQGQEIRFTEVDLS
jgi:hypothetical protein